MSKTQSYPFFIGIALAACALIIATLGLYYRHMDARFTTEGVSAEATVQVKKLEENHNADPRYLLQLGYQDAEKKPVQGWVAIPHPLWDSLKEGGSVPVQFLKTQPDTVRLAAPELHETGQGQLKLAAVGGVIALLSFGLWGLKARKA